jgi:hypothetical protein
MDKCQEDLTLPKLTGQEENCDEGSSHQEAIYETLQRFADYESCVRFTHTSVYHISTEMSRKKETEVDSQSPQSDPPDTNTVPEAGLRSFRILQIYLTYSLPHLNKNVKKNSHAISGRYYLSQNIKKPTAFRWSHVYYFRFPRQISFCKFLGPRRKPITNTVCALIPGPILSQTTSSCDFL